MVDRLNTEFNFMQNALSLRSQRMEVLSTNIANADTPNYKARDFDFKTALLQATDAAAPGLAPPVLATTSERHIPGVGASMPGAGGNIQFRVPFQQSMDGNTVEMDVERVAFAENALQQQANISFVNARIRALNAALQN